MTAMTAWATRLADGKRIDLTRATGISVTSSLGSPAQGAVVTAAVDAFPGALGSLTVALGPRVLFQGRMDKQTAGFSPKGRLLTLEARSKGALLLDNEAVPCTLAGAQLSTVFRQFAEPYGFLLVHPGGARRLALYTVPKGISEWEALCRFSRRALGITPYVTGDQVVVDAPRGGSPLVVGGAGLPYTRLEHIYEPYRMISKVVLRDAEGHYRTAVHNSSADYHGVRRKRYAIPAGEFADAPGLDANSRIRRSMLGVERVQAVIPGIVQVTPGRGVRVADSQLTAANLLADEVAWRQEQGGMTTTLGLVSGVYYG